MWATKPHLRLQYRRIHSLQQLRRELDGGPFVDEEIAAGGEFSAAGVGGIGQCIVGDLGLLQP